MELVYGILLLAVLAVAWIGARHLAAKKRAREARRRRRQRRSAGSRAGTPDTVSPRSDMRSTDSPVTVADAIKKRAKARDVR